jgi:hypothetical protein
MFSNGRLHGIWVGERCFGVSPAEFLTWFFFVLVSFFLLSQICSLRLVFSKTRISTVVANFFRSSSLQPRLCQFFTLDTWPTSAREVTLWIGMCGSQFVFQGAFGGFGVFRQISAVEEITGGGACSTHADADDGAS